MWQFELLCTHKCWIYHDMYYEFEISTPVFEIRKFGESVSEFANIELVLCPRPVAQPVTDAVV
jgi:hypothetical protein